MYKHCLACIFYIKHKLCSELENKKKSTLCYCFTWMVFIELSFIVVLLLIRKTWNDQFVGKVRDKWF